MVRVRIATFNLENLDDEPRADVPLLARKAALRPELERLDADILCLQEVNGQHVKGESERVLSALRAVLEGTRYEGFRMTSTHRHPVAGQSLPRPGSNGVLDVHNLVTLSRFPILSSREVLHDCMPPAIHQVLAVPGSELKTITFERPVLLTDIDIGSRAPLSVINVHFRAPIAAAIAGQKEAPFVWSTVAGWAEGFYLAGLKRSGQALETRLLVERMFERSPLARIVVAGDFNAEASETPLKILAASVEDTGNARLGGNELIVLDNGIAEDQRYSLRHGGRRLMLDHILASATLAGGLRSIAVHNEHLKDEVRDRGCEAGSFHAPLVAEFEIEE